MKVHPAAESLPMMSAEELKELTADIKKNGLLHPIFTDSTGELLIDGRNRLKACNTAGVKPKFQRLKRGQDLVAYIVSANLERRNMTKGQKAMVLAMIYPEPERGGRGKKSKARNLLETSGFSRQRLDQARAVLSDDKVMAEMVRDGNLTLDRALDIVRKRRHSKMTNPSDRSEKESPRSSNLKDLSMQEGESRRMPFRSIYVHFDNLRNEAEFSKRIGQRISPKQRSIKYPRRPRWWEPYWVGMPTFVQEDCMPLKTLRVDFESKEDVQAFSNCVGQKITDKTRYIYYPKQKLVSSANLAWFGGVPDPNDPLVVYVDANSKYSMYIKRVDGKPLSLADDESDDDLIEVLDEGN